MKIPLLIPFCFIFLLLLQCTTDNNTVGFFTDQESSQVDFALSEIETALAEKDIRIQATELQNARLVLTVDTNLPGINSEGYQISRNAQQIMVKAVDEAGLMYGGLELAEQVRLYGWDGIQEVSESPYMALRGSKFNIPLDVRTPSYSDYSDVAQSNMPEMWSLEFWKEYIDNMARYRYNFISLWSLNPFPSLVRVPDYPDIALDDVHRSKGPFKEYYHLRGIESDIPDLVNNYEVIKALTIDEKIEFWNKVMAYGKSRNIDFYTITWNIFVNGTDGKYGITEDFNNDVTKDYIKKSLKQMFITYPELAGVGLTTGENMSDLTWVQKEDWAFDTYGQAILEIADEMPERNFTLIHRQHFADPTEIAKKFAPVAEKENVEFIYSFKYAKAHVFSSTRQPYHEEFVKNIGDLKTIWTLRNDDAYYFRWGAPDFVREFMLNIPYDVSRGYYYGSDQWIWGREFTSKNVEGPRQLEVVKHWYNWMMWGRLGYSPDLSNQRFIKIIENRFSEVDGLSLFTAWQEASMIYPVTTAFHWGDVDFKWYIEGCRSNAIRSANNQTGFHDVDLFINYPVHAYSGFQSIPNYVQSVVDGKTSELSTPLKVAEMLHEHSNKALALIGDMTANDHQELQATLHDIKTMALLGKYYAHKIAGATYVALYREIKDAQYQDKAIEELTSALDFWKKYAESALEENINPIWTNRVGHVDWAKTTEWVENDVEIARSE